MGWSNLDFVQALGVAIATVVGAVTARQAGEVRKLRARITELERRNRSDSERFRDALRLIRQLLRHSDELTDQLRQHVPGVKTPAAPAIPAWLENEL
ncbi:hypothetical protein IU500_17450 [Nocardia terpenica]|uniref:hypothetical protein n=1 Tax=Nocardia terpenica TaxID=455432 RepID=UPI001892DAE1|nr:hypothetical protein [Nocardia terpenica]MBF6063271.1 hypothetical protein [Nocardia terpenica]MBF6105827.1 hypothetical protein [Nocardia terpenica]MBF6113589.1 hypothetical protein [Nocardia terpenica]MBF6119568.1 hypothetical protein [Nocardia terpenica]MBF6151979.1 hypothetical protein [Nocardia terpenica]